jgi:acyl-CoA reductase-like NAD-dependent aldehyde dehydrogenase
MAGTMMHYLAGRWTKSGDTMAVTNPYDDRVVGEVYLATAGDFQSAIAAAHAVRGEVARQATSVRTRILHQVAAGLEHDQDKFAQMITWETGRAIKDTAAEVGRAAFTFRTAAEEARRLAHEFSDLDWLPGTEQRYALVRRVPVGVVGAITPFNFPLNLVAHKIAPAIAAGCPIVLKPASKTPIVALMLCRLLDDAGLLPGALSVLPARADQVAPLVDDDRVRLLTFTGSPEVGWELRKRAGRKHVTLELGGNAGCIVHADCDLAWAVNRVTAGAFSQAGQSCISVQRVFVHADRWDAFLHSLLERTASLRTGDPSDPKTDVGPLVDDAAADRIEAWLESAQRAGATVHCGGQRDGRIVGPAVLTGVPVTQPICCEEAFAPVVLLYRYDDFDCALKQLDDSRFGLQAGLFTYDMRLVEKAYSTLEVGGLVINDVPTFRTDQMPYGGTRDSGTGREGPRYAIEEMTERKLLVLNMKSAS